MSTGNSETGPSVIIHDLEQLRKNLEESPGLGELLLRGNALGTDVAHGMVRFYQTFAQSIAGLEVNGAGLNQAWTHAAAATLEAPASAGLMVRSGDGFEALIRAITTEEEVITETLRLRRLYLKELEDRGMAERSEWGHLGDWDKI